MTIPDYTEHNLNAVFPDLDGSLVTAMHYFDSMILFFLSGKIHFFLQLGELCFTVHTIRTISGFTTMTYTLVMCFSISDYICGAL